MRIMYVRLGGGLGNQMFQYAFIYSQIMENARDINMVMHRNVSEEQRSFALQIFNTSIPMHVIEEDSAPMQYKINLFIRKMISFFYKRGILSRKQLKKIFALLGIVYADEIYKYYDDCKIQNNTKYVEGAFQSCTYFDQFKNMLRKEFQISIAPSAKNIEMLEYINNTDSVCVHIRRGDYLNSVYSKKLAVCDYDYYHGAIEYMSKSISDATFFIFTNSHEDHLWIQENYRFNKNIVYVDLNNPDYEELRLMIACKHFIISNSTFSWWAQYLSENKAKMVIAPKSWNTSGDIFEGIYQSDWITL